MLDAAEQAMHDRAVLACDAATAAGLPGRFLVFEQAGLRVVATTAPGLAHLNIVSGVSTVTVDGVPAVLAALTTFGAQAPAVLVPCEHDGAQRRLRDWGFTAGDRRPIACADLPFARADDATGPGGQLRVRELPGRAPLARFMEVLHAGYAAPPAVTAFMAAEHSVGAMRRFVGLHGDEPVAAAAMSVHRGVAVLGGATVVPAHRGQGWQTALLQHRIRAATAAGCHAAVATAAPGSASVRNLQQLGFTIHDRRGWRPESGL